MAKSDLSTDSYLFWGDPTQGMTYEQLKARRQLAAALASRSRDYPNTIGKGLTYLGESIGQNIMDRQLRDAETRVREGDAAAAKGAREPTPTGPKTPPPPVGPVSDAGTPTLADAGITEPEVTRADIATALQQGAQGSQPAPQGAVQMAGLGRPDVMPQAAPYQSNYAGASPAGPGASMAEPPDQSPPAPSAQPVAAAGAGPAGTPAPAPGGGGVAAGGPGQGPAPPTRGDLADVAMANQSFNPDAGAQLPPGPMLAQVGGFGAPAAGAPPSPGIAGMAPPPRPGLPGLKTMPPPGPPPNTAPGARQGTLPGYSPPTEAQFNTAFGNPPPQPNQWTPDEIRRFQKQQAIVADPYRSDNARAAAKALQDQIGAERSTRFERETKAYDEKTASRRTQFEDYRKAHYDQYKTDTDPAKVGEYNRAVVNNELSVRAGGEDPAEVRKGLQADLAETRTLVKRQSELQEARDAIRSGVITGTLGDLRINAAKFAAWLGSQPADVRATNTEILEARLKAGVAEAVKEFKPASNTDVALAAQIRGASANLQLGTIKQILDATVRNNNDAISRYDNKVDRLTGGIEELAKYYKSPNLDHIPDAHAEMLAQAVRSGDRRTIEFFDEKYGPGTAAMAINRMKLGGKR